MKMAIERQIRCPKCVKLLCKIVDIGSARLVYLKHRKLKAMAPMMVITCAGCGTACRIGPNGIEDKNIGNGERPIQPENG
jgi:hypothetical protein